MNVVFFAFTLLYHYENLRGLAPLPPNATGGGRSCASCQPLVSGNRCATKLAIEITPLKMALQMDHWGYKHRDIKGLKASTYHWIRGPRGSTPWCLIFSLLNEFITAISGVMGPEKKLDSGLISLTMPAIGQAFKQRPHPVTLCWWFRNTV